MSDVRIDDAAVFALINDEDGPVGMFIQELAARAAVTARGLARVRATPAWSSRTDARPPGFTKASVHTARGHTSTGHFWASANAPADPAIFLEYPREDRDKYPFLTTGLWSLEGTF